MIGKLNVYRYKIKSVRKLPLKDRTNSFHNEKKIASNGSTFNQNKLFFFPIVQYQEKLSKNQDSFVQLRKEKDEMQQDFW